MGPIQIKDAEYRVTTTALLKSEFAGECHQDTKVILISTEQTKRQAWVTFFHEWLHGVEEEYKIPLGEKKIEKLEYALAQLFDQLTEKKKKRGGVAQK